jgi:hypothetical protein
LDTSRIGSGERAIWFPGGDHRSRIHSNSVPKSAIEQADDDPAPAIEIIAAMTGFNRAHTAHNSREHWRRNNRRTAFNGSDSGADGTIPMPKTRS